MANRQPDSKQQNEKLVYKQEVSLQHKLSICFWLKHVYASFPEVTVSVNVTEVSVAILPNITQT